MLEYSKRTSDYSNKKLNYQPVSLKSLGSSSITLITTSQSSLRAWSRSSRSFPHYEYKIPAVLSWLDTGSGVHWTTVVRAAACKKSQGYVPTLELALAMCRLVFRVLLVGGGLVTQTCIQIVIRTPRVPCLARNEQKSAEVTILSQVVSQAWDTSSGMAQCLQIK